MDFREREISICSPTYLCTPWLLLICALTGDRTCNLGISGPCSNQPSYLASALFNLLRSGFIPIFPYPPLPQTHTHTADHSWSSSNGFHITKPSSQHSHSTYELHLIQFSSPLTFFVDFSEHRTLWYSSQVTSPSQSSLCLHLISPISKHRIPTPPHPRHLQGFILRLFLYLYLLLWWLDPFHLNLLPLLSKDHFSPFSVFLFQTLPLGCLISTWDLTHSKLCYWPSHPQSSLNPLFSVFSIFLSGNFLFLVNCPKWGKFYPWILTFPLSLHPICQISQLYLQNIAAYHPDPSHYHLFPVLIQ